MNKIKEIINEILTHQNQKRENEKIKMLFEKKIFGRYLSRVTGESQFFWKQIRGIL